MDLGTDESLAKLKDEPLKLTPMMRQYRSVKEAHPSAIVLFRMGDFFETFFEDAEICSRLLDITLTARSKEGIPMAGVPHHALDSYLARLIEHKQTVVIVDQIEDPKDAKGLVRRDITKVISPGTFIDPDRAQRTFHYLVLIGLPPPKKTQKAGTWALAALDLATGEFRATEGDDLEVLIDEIGRLAAKELLVSKAATSDPRWERIRAAYPELATTELEAKDVEPDAARRVLCRHFGEEEAGALERLLSFEAITAAGSCLSFVERTQLPAASWEKRAGGSLGHIFALRPYVPADSLVLDAECRTHLELFARIGERERVGTLLWAIDRTITSMGARLLARYLARPLIDPESISRRQVAVLELVARPSQLDRIREGLGAVSDLSRLLGRLLMGRATPRDLSSLRKSLGSAPAVLAAAKEAADPDTLLLSLAEADPCGEVEARLSAALTEDPPADPTRDGIFRRGFDAELDRLQDLASDSKQVLASIEAREKQVTGIASLKVRYNRVFGYYLEVTKANLKLVPAHYIRKQTTVNGERYYTEELKTLEEEILGSDERRISRQNTLLAALVEGIAAEKKRLAELAEALAQIDVFAGFAALAEERGYVRPEVDREDRLEIRDGRHPVLETHQGSQKERFVPNDVVLDQEQRLLIITGPNMAGKSTIMRQTALIVILAQIGCFVPASSAKLGVVDRIFTRVGASDDLFGGRSTFMVEMTETARILRSATARSLVILDEIGRGTSTFDGLSIAWAVCEHLHDQLRSKTLFATHYHELTELCRDRPLARNFHVAVKEWNEKIVFLRKLTPGPTARSYGVQVARLAGLPPAVIERARAVLASLEAQALSAGDRTLASPKGAVRQLHLFSPPAEASADERQVISEIRAQSPDDLTPRQAHEQLADWQRRLLGGGDSSA